MNATLVMAFILIFIVVATVITKKLPFNFVLFIAPVLCALILGHSIEETSTFIVEQLASMMKSAGFMLLFAFLYFQMLTEAGVFDTIVSAITTKLGNKMNVIVIMVPVSDTHLQEEKEELKEIVDFLKSPQKYIEVGARIPKGVILVGPPGTVSYTHLDVYKRQFHHLD